VHRNILTVLICLSLFCSGKAFSNNSPTSNQKTTLSKKIIIAHGVPGDGLNSRSSFKNALAMKPDFIEADLQLTKDLVLICLHDPTLEKTTNIEEIFPTRFKTINVSGKPLKKWFINDFTLAEIKSLKGTQDVVTLKELLNLAKNRTGLYLETKDPFIYHARKLDIDWELHQFLTTEVFEKPEISKNTTIIIESFHETSLKRLRDLGGERYTLIQLVWFSTWHKYMSDEGLKHVASYADGIGPILSMVLPPSQQVIKDAHARGLLVHAWKGYEAVPPKGISHQVYYEFLLYNLGLDGIMSSTPDQIKRH